MLTKRLLTEYAGNISMIRQSTIRTAQAKFGSRCRPQFKRPLHVPVAICFLLSLGSIARQCSAASSASGTSNPHQYSCRIVRLTGDVSEGHEWSAAIGEGWLFRMVPIPPRSNSKDGHAYSGWDLVVDREKGGGYPDALLLGTPPYGSLNEREIGTTFGMRAQDAIAWEPRRFHFLTNLRDWTRARELFPAVIEGSGSDVAPSNSPTRNKAAYELLQIVGKNSGSGRTASGEFSVLDARLKSGVSDPPAYALQWAAHLGQVPHKLEQADAVPGPMGELLWLRFGVTLWLPGSWKAPPRLASKSASCAQ